MRKNIVFTDLDGTLLDCCTYSFEKAIPALELLRGKNIPLVLCSSKTRKEIEYYRKELANNHPFISENGGGIFIPKNYFKFKIHSPEFIVYDGNDYYAIKFGAQYSDLRKTVEGLRKKGFKIKGFGDMTVKEIMEIANLSADEAEMAKERDFDEPFIFEGNATETQRLLRAIKAKGFNCTQGRFFHIIGNTDKGKAVELLKGLYRKEFYEITTIALGDSSNDIPMLAAVDYPIVVQKPGGGYDQKIDMPGLIRASGIGPEGWNNAIIKLIRNQNSLSPESL
jgi:mannosyl-3-phosphoglycerate phosphatase